MRVRFLVQVRRSPAGLGAGALAGLVILSACAGTEVRSAGPTPRPLGRDLPVYRPLPPGESGGLRPTEFQNPAGTLTLRDAVGLALLHNPDLAAFAWETRAREAWILQADRPPNPVLSVLAEDLGASRLEGSSPSSAVVQPQTTLLLSQLVELGGKRAARRNLAALDRDLAAWDYETVRIEVFTRVARAFIDVLAAQETAALTERMTETAGEVHRSVSARVAAGVVSPIEETRARIAFAAVRVESDQARRLVDATRGRLAATWGGSEAVFQSVVGDLSQVPALPALDELKVRLRDHPNLARWAAEISQREAALALEQSKRVPDVLVSAGYRRFTDVGSNAFVVGGSVPLPIFDRNDGGIETARSRLAKAHEERRAAEARVSAALAEAYGALSSAHAGVVALRDDVLPGAQEAFAAVSEGYRLGKFGYLDVLDAQRTLIGANGQYLRALSDYHKAVVEVERLIGAPLHGPDGLTVGEP